MHCTLAVTHVKILFRHFSANHPYATDLHALGENRRLVTTPTYRDVRQTLYRSSLARWEHYHTWLADLHAGLGPEWPGK